MRWGLAIIGSVFIWAMVIFATAMVLEGVPQSSRVLQILGGGAAATIILLGGMMTRQERIERGGMMK